jgi:hypothetical protein
MNAVQDLPVLVARDAGFFKDEGDLLEKDPTPYAHYLARETGGLLQPHELQAWRLLHAAPQPYTRERFDDTYNWTVK